MNTAPFISLYDLGKLGAAGDETSVSANESERAAIAVWADVQAVKTLTGKLRIRRLATGRFQIDGTMDADIVQACVVSLAPMPAHIERTFARELHFAGVLPRSRRNAPEEVPSLAPIVLNGEEEDIPEEIESLRYDLAGPILEELLLGIDPYPRAPGVAFEPPPEEDDGPANPFAALKGLKS